MKKNLIIVFLYLFIMTQVSLVCAEENYLEYFHEGEELYNEAQYDQAIKLFEKVVDLAPEYAPVFNALGLAYSGKGAPLSDSIWFYNIAIDIDPKYVEVYQNMCQAYFSSGEADKAEDACLKALDLDPSLGGIKLTLAWIYLRGKSQPSEAIFYFKEVLEQVKKPMIYYGLGVAYVMKGDMGQVLDVVTILRSMKEENLASQLEKMIQGSSVPIGYTKPDLAIPQRQSGELVTSPVVDVPSLGGDISPQDSGPVEGSMKIRLKGKLMDTTDPASKEHPASLSE